MSKPPAIMNSDNGHSTKHRWSVVPCTNKKCKFYAEEIHHENGRCVACKHGGVWMGKVKTHFNNKERGWY